MEPVNRDEVELIVNRAIAQHELRFSIFGVLTAVLSILVGLAIAGAP